MDKIGTIGLDLAKQVFQVHGVDCEGRVLARQRTMLINALRGHLAEFGIVTARGPAAGAIAELHAMHDSLPPLARAASASRATDTSAACSSRGLRPSSGWRARPTRARSGRRSCWSASPPGSSRSRWPTRRPGSPGPCWRAISPIWPRPCSVASVSVSRTGAGAARVVRCDDEPAEPGTGQTRSVSSARCAAS